MPASNDWVIALDRVEKSYHQVKVVDDVSLQIETGECIVMVGHNGAGKTTLMKLMLGLTRPSSGEVRVQGQDPANPGFVQHRLSLGYLPESVSFYPHLSGRELLRHYARLKNIAESEVSQRLEQLGLTHAAGRRLGTYSKGMRQRLGLAQAILGNPKTLFLDEPTTGLDPLLRRDFYQIIEDLRAGGTTVVISSHALNEVEAQADRIAVIREGQLVACGSLQALRNQADLPVRLRLTVSPGTATEIAAQLPAHLQTQELDESTLEALCGEGEKMSILRHITGLNGSVHDVSIGVPRLDEIYLHFMNGDQA